MHVLVEQLNLGSFIAENLWISLGVASVTGLIPESGPHLFFVLLFTKGTIPFTILLANSLLQDGHGMLALLAHSRKGFLLVKLINFAVGPLVGRHRAGAGILRHPPEQPAHISVLPVRIFSA